MRLEWEMVGTGDGPTPPTAPGSNSAVFRPSRALASRATHFVLLPEPPCCAGCVPADPTGAVEVYAAAPLPLRQGELCLQGRWQVRRHSGSWRYTLREARALVPPGWSRVTPAGDARRRAADVPGRLRRRAPAPATRTRAARRCSPRRPSTPIRMPAASPTCGASAPGRGFRRSPRRCAKGLWRCRAWPWFPMAPPIAFAADGRIHPFRSPEPGELAAYGDLCFRPLARPWPAPRG